MLVPAQATLLVFEQREQPAFKEAISERIFYPDTSLGSRGTNSPAWINPRINQWASIAIILALALFMHRDNVSTLQSVAPVEVLLWSERTDVWGLYSRAVAVGLHGVWICRAVLVPALASIAAALSFAVAKNAQEIVVDGLAIAFVFELDELFFDQLLGQRMKRRGRSRTFSRDVLNFQRAFCSSSDDEINFWLVYALALLLYVADVFAMYAVYTYAVYNEHVVFIDEAQYAVYMRGLLAGLAHVATAVSHRRGRVAAASVGRRVLDGARVVAQLAIVVGSCVAAWAILFEGLVRHFGHRYEVVSMPHPLHAADPSMPGVWHAVSLPFCLSDGGESPECMYLDRFWRNMDDLRAYVCDELDACPRGHVSNLWRGPYNQLDAVRPYFASAVSGQAAESGVRA